MAAVLSTNKDTSTVNKVFVRYKEVKEVYVGNKLVWKDDDAQTVIREVKEFFEFYSPVEAMSTEVSPLPIEGKISGHINTFWHAGSMIYYGKDGKESGRKRFVIDTSDESGGAGTLTVDDVLAKYVGTLGSYPFYEYTIPENQQVCGKTYTVSQVSPRGKYSVTEYQTSNENALFGLTSDVYPGFNYSSARDYISVSGLTYSISQASTLVFRPLKRCQINFSRTGYYFYDEKNATIQLMHSNLQHEIGITSLPKSLEDLDTDTFKNTGFKSLPQSLIIEPGKILLVGFLEEGTFWFSEIFSLDKSHINLQAIGSSSPVKIIADDNVSWTAETTSSWLTLNKTNGKGSDTLTISATKNTSGSTRTGLVKISSATQDLRVYVTQPNYAVALEFGTVPGTFIVTTISSNTWEISENEIHATRGQEFTLIPFTPTKNGTVGLMSLATEGLETCDVSMIGATISQNKTSYDPNEAITICDIEDSNTYSVIAGNTYYVQIYRADAAIMEYAVSVQLSFNAS